jgi:hypothetical protein
VSGRTISMRCPTLNDIPSDSSRIAYSRLYHLSLQPELRPREGRAGTGTCLPHHRAGELLHEAADWMDFSRI